MFIYIYINDFCWSCTVMEHLKYLSFLFNGLNQIQSDQIYILNIILHSLLIPCVFHARWLAQISLFVQKGACPFDVVPWYFQCSHFNMMIHGYFLVHLYTSCPGRPYWGRWEWASVFHCCSLWIKISRKLWWTAQITSMLYFGRCVS